MNDPVAAAFKSLLLGLEALERGPEPRHYVDEPAADYRDQESDAEQFFNEQQCPSDSFFGR
jgi:hypothetical protein